ncbi:molybdopterin synthase catalytic subunit MoaE [Utexia brackfieldae]|uniref:molybdopterin synthase catalytic subunit MoaE n=1 Tax=Utexia brackfieldae TaxID=3074108 RepID=UPI00370DB1DA
MATRIEVTNDMFDVTELNEWLSLDPQDGAIVTFMGKVRTLESETLSLYLEHYQGMTEQVLWRITEQARARWSLNHIVIIHRIGEILANQAIVFVGVSGPHRKAAFAAAEFMMDILKSEAPFWKREKTQQGDAWVEAKQSDQAALKKWF